MDNKFASNCNKCGTRVSVGAGTIKKIASGWLVVHKECPTNIAAISKVQNYSLNRLLYDEPDECFERYGITESDFRDAVNPDEGDHF